jgi:hypothetical protein
MFTLTTNVTMWCVIIGSIAGLVILAVLCVADACGASVRLRARHEYKSLRRQQRADFLAERALERAR